MSGLIYKKMADVMRDVGSVGKNQKNSAQGFKFRGIDDMINAFYPALTKHGVFISPRVVSASQEIKDVVRGNGKAGVDKHVALMVEYDFFAEDGSKVTVGPIASEGLDSGDKATNKALSAALKYALIQTFSIPTADMEDGDSTTPELGKTLTKVELTAPINTISEEVTATATVTEIPKKKVTFSKKAATTATGDDI